MTLSGRVDTLENQVTFITQDLIQKIDVSTSASNSTSWNQQMDAFEDTVNVLSAQLHTLQSLYTNLYMSVQSHYYEFTGHRDSAVTGVTPVHTGVY